MSIISASGLGKSFGGVDIFSGISLSVPTRGRIGLVGANGVGKTTLLRILAGLEEPSAGAVQRARGVTIGYLAQEAVLDTHRTLWEECLEAFGSLLERQAELRRLETIMSDPTATEETLHAYGRLQHEFDLLGGYTFESRIRQTLTGLGFSRRDEKRPLHQLSGGQRTRAMLARLLLTSPDLLLLDEPTNHLDISAIEWLENYLRDWDGAVVIVSHDRYFLDQAVTTIWEMTPALEVYRGNYSAYLKQRGERYKRLLGEYQNQQEFIEKEQDYIQRNIAGQNTRQAQGRRKRLERMLEEVRMAPPVQPRRLRMNLKAVGRSGDLVLRTLGLSIGYADEGRALFEVPNLTLLRGECAAIIGPNGAGKTTLLKTLLGHIPPLSGEVILGASLQVGYFAQAHESLHPGRTLLEEIAVADPKMLPGQMRDYLAKFLFTGEDVFKTVEQLSGGERGRLALACLALQGANLLLLDEPTNHLDLPSQEVLQSILGEFNGTILLVSHDRYLLDGLGTQIWEVFPGEVALRVFQGSYSEYKASLQAQAQSVTQRDGGQSTGRKPEPVRNTPSKHEKQRHRRAVEAIEKEIALLEEKKAAISRQLENPPADPARVQQLGHEYLQLEKVIENKLGEWQRLSEQE